MASFLAPSYLTPADGYRLWAHTYDHEPNPILSLEQRVLEPLLPNLGGLDVVDLGCGTGRWLDVLKGAGARSLVGVDLSREMLNLAAAKLGGAARLLCADYADAALASGSADIVFCNFVLSYIDDAEQFFRLVRKILRPGSLFYLSDVHPETASAQNWRRGVHGDSSFREIRTHRRAINAVVELCTKAGLELSFRLEPPFGESERALFAQSGKQEYFEYIREFPAIYLLRMAKPKDLATCCCEKAKQPESAACMADGLPSGLRKALLRRCAFRIPASMKYVALLATSLSRYLQARGSICVGICCSRA